jgi:hypothetical protein
VHAECAIHGLTIWKKDREVGIQQDKIHSGSGLAMVFTPYTASQLREIVLVPQIVTVLDCRCLLHTVYARKAPTDNPIRSLRPRTASGVVSHAAAASFRSGGMRIGRHLELM